MPKPLMRIPYTGPLPAPRIIPRNANTKIGAIAALSKFLYPAAPHPPPRPHPHIPYTAAHPTSASASTASQSSQPSFAQTVVLSGAGISVASGLADYRGNNGTYRLNPTYRPIYYHEFLASHESRKRYWARSFLGWTNLHKARPNASHFAIRDLGRMGIVQSVITQNVDSFHSIAHPELSTIELHGYLRSLVCTTCHTELDRWKFQNDLARLNPAWAAFLEEVIASGALDTENPDERRKKGLKTNPDGDVDLPDAPYSTFRYPACPKCLAHAPVVKGVKTRVEVDGDGAWRAGGTAGVLKPAVVMFGESISESVKGGAERAIDGAGRVLVIGSSLATYSAWRLVRRAKEGGKKVGVLNLGGVRGEEAFFMDLESSQQGEAGVRLEMPSDIMLPELVEELRRRGIGMAEHGDRQVGEEGKFDGSGVFKDMLS